MHLLKQFVKLIFVLCIPGIFFSHLAFAANNSPVGFWKVIEEKQEKPSSIVQITQKNGRLYGHVVKIYDNPNAVCTKCSGDLHNKPIMGMQVMWDFIPKIGGWGDGRVLAVKRGKAYSASLNLQEGGQRLQILVKTPLGNRVQNWERANSADG